MHTAPMDDAVPGMGLSNTWVRDVSVVLPTFTAAIDDVTMAFAERLKVGAFPAGFKLPTCVAGIHQLHTDWLPLLPYRHGENMSAVCPTRHMTHSVSLRQAMANNVAVMDSGGAMPSVLPGDAAGKAAPGNGTQFATVAAVAERLAELETALVAQAAMVAAKRYALCTHCRLLGRLQPANGANGAEA